MKKFLLSISKSWLVLCLTLHTVLAMEIGELRSKDTNNERPVFVMKCRNSSTFSYKNGMEAESLWQKRKYYLQALRSSKEIFEKFPDLQNQEDRDHHKLIKDTLERCAHNQWMCGMSLISKPHKEPAS